jgi:hypothetical protein
MINKDEKKFILSIVDNCQYEKEDILIEFDECRILFLYTDKDVSGFEYTIAYFLIDDLKLEFKNLGIGRYTLKELGLDD